MGSRNAAGRGKSGTPGTPGSLDCCSRDDDSSDIDVVGDDDDSMDYESSSTAAPEDSGNDDPSSRHPAADPSAIGTGPINYVKREGREGSEPSERPSPHPGRPWEGEEHPALPARPFSMVGMGPLSRTSPPYLLNNNSDEANNNHKDPLRSSPVKLNPFSIEYLLSRGGQATTAPEPLAAES